MQLAVHQRPARLDVSDVEEVLVGAAGETDAEFLAHGGARAVAASEEHGVACRPLQIRHDAIAFFPEVDQFALAVDVHVELCETLDQEPLVFVLRVDEAVRIRALALAECAELDVRHLLRPGPEIRPRKLEAGLDHLAGETELAIELQRPRLDRQSAGGRPGLGRPVDDADPDAQPGEPESEHEARRTGADDEDFGVHARQS